MVAVLLTPPYLQFLDDEGNPLSGGKVYTYTATGTFTTPKATYTTAAGDTEADNPVILDAAGRPQSGGGSIWLSGTYDFKVTDSLDNTIETTLNVTAFNTLPSQSNAYFQSFSGNGSQVAFTTSSDLGTDEKAIYVWVDAGLMDKVGYEIQNPSTYTIDGTTLTFGSAPASGTGNIYVSAPSLLVGAASSSAASAASSAAAALASEIAAQASEDAAAIDATDAAASAVAASGYAASLSSTSTTSLIVSGGPKTFTTQANKQYTAGQYLIASSSANNTNYMHGTVTSYSGTTLVMNISDVGGTGTYADWVISLSGTQGPIGATGSGGNVYTNGYFTNNYYFGGFGYYNFTGYTVAANIIYCAPFMVRSTTIFTRIGVNVITTGVGTAGRLGIYNIANGYPTTLVLDAGTVSLGTTGIKEITVSQTLTPGIYAMVFIANGAATMLSANAGTNGTDMAALGDVWGITLGNYTGGGAIVGYVHALTYGTLPGTFPSSSPAQSDINNVLLSMRVV